MDDFPTEDRTQAAKDELSTDPRPAWSGIARGPARWDMGSGEPPEEVQAVLDYTAEGEGEDSPHWGRTRSGWKGYKDGGKVYLDWPELVRRWGPVAEGRP